MTEIHYTDSEPFPEEMIVEKSLRPSRFDEFIGQEELIKNLKLSSPLKTFLKAVYKVCG